MQCLSHSSNRRCCLWHAQEEGIKPNNTYVLTHTCNRSHFCPLPLPPSSPLPVPPSCSSHSLPSIPVHRHPSPYYPSPVHHCSLLSLSPPCATFPSLFLLPFSLFLLLPSAFNRLPHPLTIHPSGRLSRHGGRNDSLSTPSDKHFKSNSRHQ
jgi:hypothetical protein